MKIAWLLTTILALGCGASRPTPTDSAPSTAPTSPTPDLATASIEVSGWRSLQWGDTSAAANTKARAEGLTACRETMRAKKKGFIVTRIGCRRPASDASGLSSVGLFFLDDRLGRVTLSYDNMQPSSARVRNLGVALAAKYCAMQTSLEDAVLEARAGNFGQELQVDFPCPQTKGTVFVSITNHTTVSDVEIFLQSYEFEAYQKKNEFTDTL